MIALNEGMSWRCGTRGQHTSWCNGLVSLEEAQDGLEKRLRMLRWQTYTYLKINLELLPIQAHAMLSSAVLAVYPEMSRAESGWEVSDIPAKFLPDIMSEAIEAAHEHFQWEWCLGRTAEKDSSNGAWRWALGPPKKQVIRVDKPGWNEINHPED